MSKASHFSDIGKGTIPIVVVYDIATEICHNQVFEAIIVEVARDAPLSVPVVTETSQRRDILECLSVDVTEEAIDARPILGVNG